MVSVIARTVVASVIVAAALAAPTAAPAGAENGVTAGWWTAASPLPVAPDGEDGLLIQGGPDADEPISYAAVEYLLSSGETPVVLNLTVRSASASTPNTELVACPLVERFEPESGASMSEAPEYDCEVRSVAAEPEEMTYSFFIGGLEDDGRLALAILPSAPTDRVVVEQPKGSDLRTTEPATTGDPPAPDGPSTADAAGGIGATTEPPKVSPSFATGAPSTPAPVSEPAARPAEHAAGASGSRSETTEPTREGALAAAAVPSLSGSDGAKPLAALTFVVLAAAAATMWLMAGRRGTEDGETASATP